MYPVFVDKDFAESVLRSIATDQPIAPRGQWTVRDMVFVAGALRFAAMSHGPVRFVDDGGKPRLATVEESQGLNDEYQSMVLSTLTAGPCAGSLVAQSHSRPVW
jgi:hypothetical protein